MIETREITRDLPVPLTHDEQRDLIQRQYQAEADTVAAQRERAVKNREINARIAGNRKTIDEIKATIAAGEEDRPVACREERDFARCVVRVIRLDTDELVEERTMEPEERQAGLPLGEGQDQAAA